MAACAGRVRVRRGLRVFDAIPPRSSRSASSFVRRPNSRPAAYESVVFGLHSALATLSCAPARVERAYVLAGGAGVAGAVVPALAALAARRAGGLPVARVDRAALDALARGGTHQGVVLVVAPLELAALPDGLSPAEWAAAAAASTAAGGSSRPPPAAHPVLLALDDVTDPHNVGAALRCALLLGADGVVLPAPPGGARAAPSALLGATVAKTSAGALEVWAATGRLHGAASLPTLLATWAAAGWRVLGAAAPLPLSPAAPHVASGASAPADEAAAAFADAAAATDRRDRDATASLVVEGGGGSPTPAAAAAPNASRVRGGRSPDDRGGGAPVDVPFATLSRRDAEGTILVVGNEGGGLRAAVKRSCTHFVSVPQRGARLQAAAMAGAGAGVGAAEAAGAPGAAGARGAAAAGALVCDSLNVATATALLLEKLAPLD